MSLAFLFPYLMLSMFRVLIHPSSGARDLFVELFHGMYCSGTMCVGVTVWFGRGGVVSLCRLQPASSAWVWYPYAACQFGWGVVSLCRLKPA
jgi:hypothetical protein